MSENKAQEIRELIAELKAKRAEELETIRKKEAKAQDNKSASLAKMKAATEELDLSAYGTAKSEYENAKTEMEMYAQRREQLSKEKIISEEESDKVIDGLLSYEEELAAEFEKAISEPLRILDELQRKYSQEVRETEAVIREWTGEIHANYNTRGASQYYDELTETYTTRSAVPVPVHPTTYTGSPAAVIIKDELTGKLSKYIGQDPGEDTPEPLTATHRRPSADLPPRTRARKNG